VGHYKIYFLGHYRIYGIYDGTSIPSTKSRRSFRDFISTRDKV